MGLHYALGCVCWLGTLHGCSATFDGGLVSISARSQIALVNIFTNQFADVDETFYKKFCFKGLNFKANFTREKAIHSYRFHSMLS